MPDASEQLKQYDEDVITEGAWSIIEAKGWVPTPALLFALKAYIEDEIIADLKTQGLIM